MFLKRSKYTLIALLIANSLVAQIKENEKLGLKDTFDYKSNEYRTVVKDQTGVIEVFYKDNHIKSSIKTGLENLEITRKLIWKDIPNKVKNNFGIVTNQTGIIEINIQTKRISKPNCSNNDTISLKIFNYSRWKKHSIVDYLSEEGLKIVKIFSPEHGFRGDADAGATVESGRDVKTGLPIVSLYGKNKKPTQEQMADLDYILFDIQDVGARFYTYISTLHYVMEAAAENGVKVIVLDRPNPNGHYIDGPVLQPKFQSFVGMHSVPIVYGMTIGEYALMINGEKWLYNGVQCDLTVIPLTNYTHRTPYSLPVMPSPNLPNDQSINLYPSTCFFEAFNGSEGRGTDKPFQVYGSPYLKNMDYQFVPEPNSGASNPRFKGQVCYGEDLSNSPKLNEINLDWLIQAYRNFDHSQEFWIKNEDEFWIDKLAGTDELRKQIEQGWSAEKIKASWQKDLAEFKKIRAKYLLYN